MRKKKMQNKKYGTKEDIFTPNLKSLLARISQKIAHLFVKFVTFLNVLVF